MPKGIYKRKPPETATLPITDPENILGRAYAIELRARAKLLRTSFMPTKDVRGRMADDLEALAVIAEKHPEVFAVVGATLGTGGPRKGEP